MQKNVIILLSVVAVSFLMGFLLLKKNSPIVYLACKKSVGAGCYLDRCGICKNRGEQDTALPSPELREMLGDGCLLSLGYVDMRGYKCSQVNDKCVLQKSWRTPLCQSLSKVNSKWRINLGIENENLFYYGENP